MNYDYSVKVSAVMKSITAEYNSREAWKTGGLQLAWIEKAVLDAVTVANEKDHGDVRAVNIIDTVTGATIASYDGDATVEEITADINGNGLHIAGAWYHNGVWCIEVVNLYTKYRDEEENNV